MIYDITPPITDRLKVWPADTPPAREVLCDTRRDGAVTLSTLRAAVHLGAHNDVPSHYGAGDGPREELLTAVLESINGVAAGLKNTG